MYPLSHVSYAGRNQEAEFALSEETGVRLQMVSHGQSIFVGGRARVVVGRMWVLKEILGLSLPRTLGSFSGFSSTIILSMVS